MIPTLRDYQIKAVTDVRVKYAQGFRAPVLVIPTGGGKTVIFAYIAHQTALKGRRVLILVHRIELLRQTQAKLKSFGVRVGLISPKYAPDPAAPVQVAMVQTMVNRTHIYKNFDLVVTDECHHVAASGYLKILSAYPDAYQLGVTATPVRADGKGLGVGYGGVYDSMVVGPTINDLIGAGHLVAPRIFAPPSLIDFTGLRQTAGDWNRKDLNERTNKRQITGSAVDHYKQLCPGDPAVAFCVSIQHARDVAAEFQAAGFRAFAADGGMEDIERQRILNGLADGRTQIVCSCDLISEGTDIPEIAAAIMLRPTQSFGLFLQQIGRALRPSAGKDCAIILDHAGNTAVHGLPTQDMDWTLEGELKSKKKAKNTGPAVTMCGECFAAFESYKRACPQCGAIREVSAREMETVDGELREITAAEAALMNRNKRIEVGRAKTIDELRAIAAARGYKPAWAQHVYNSRQKTAQDG